MEGKGWEGIKAWLPSSHVWVEREAKREKRRGRAKGGTLLGKRKGWDVGKESWCCRGENGLMTTKQINNDLTNEQTVISQVF